MATVPEAKRGKGGRPLHGDQPKKAYFNMRTDPELRARVEASARAHGLPMVQEVERLVRRGLQAEAPET